MLKYLKKYWFFALLYVADTSIYNAGQRDRRSDKCNSILWTVYRSNSECNSDSACRSIERALFYHFCYCIAAV